MASTQPFLELGHCANRSALRGAESANGAGPQDSALSLPSVYVLQATTATSKIEAVFERIADSLLNGDTDIAIYLKRRPTSVTCNLSATGGVASTHVVDRRIAFPGKDAHEAWRFTAFIRILELIHQALTLGVVTTKRDIFYKDPALFVKQSVVDRYVDDIAHTFNVPRSALSVAAAAKGLVAGAFFIARENGTTINGTEDREGILIPILSSNDSIEMNSVRWILVIEKEATFHSLMSSAFWHDLVRQGIIITGKGYPDITTRAFLRRLSNCLSSALHRHIPIYGLVDYDPDGIAILSTYKHGSVTLAHENHALTVPNMLWMGLRSYDMAMAGNSSLTDDTRQDQALMVLSARDRKRATNMLIWEHLGEIGLEADSRRELQVMLILNMKAEIQMLDKVDNGVQSWVLGKLAGL